MGSHRHHHEPAVDTHTFLQEGLELVVAIELRSAPLVLAGVVREDGIRVQAVEEVLDGVGVSIDDLGRLDERADLRRVSAAVRAPYRSVSPPVTLTFGAVFGARLWSLLGLSFA